jgi:hypothetical protein
MSAEGYSGAGFLNWCRIKGYLQADNDGKHLGKVKRLKNGALARCICIMLPNEDRFTQVQEGWPE